MRKATLARAGAVTLATFGLAACGAILGIDERPLRAADASTEAAPNDGGADAPCVPSPEQGCKSCEKHDFCDDFDRGEAPDGEVPYKDWSFTLLPKPFVKRGTVATALGGLSAPFSISSTAASDGGSAYSIGLHELDHDALRPGHTFAGVRYTFWLRVEEMSFAAEAGPVPGGGTAYVGALLTTKFGGKPAGVAILVGGNGAHLALSTDILESTGTDSIARIFEGKVLDIAKANWIRVEMVVADQKRAVELGYDSCRTVAPGPVAAAMLSLPTYQTCLAMPTIFNGMDWAKEPVVGAGVGSFGAASLRVGHDNVAVDFLD